MIFPLAAIVIAAALQTPGLDLPKKHLTPKPKADTVLATVGGVSIKASDMEPYLWDWRAYEALQDAITHQMIAAEAKAKGVSVSDEEVQKQLDAQLEALRSQLRPGQTLGKAMLEQGFPRSRLFLRIRSETLLNKLVLKAFDPKSFVKVSTIVVRPRSEQASEISQALKRAEDAYQALVNGEPWADVLARVTDEGSAIQNEGLLGWRDLGAFPPTVRQELETKKPGAITKPAQTSNGFQIFRLEALGSTAQGPIVEELKDAYLAGTRQKYLEDLRARTKIDVLLGK